MAMPTLQQIIGTITGKVAFERTQANFNTIKDAHNGLETSLTTHKADYTSRLARTAFSVTPSTGVTISAYTKTFTTNNIAYIALAATRSDGGSFPVGLTNIGIIPQTPITDIVALNSYALDAGGNPVDVKQASMAQYNKTIRAIVVSANVKTIYITGWYLLWEV